MIRDANKEKRVAQARAWLESKEQFDDVIFTDETSVALERYSRLSFKNGTHLSIKSRHPPKVHVWGAISRDGPGPIVISEGTVFMYYAIFIIALTYCVAQDREDPFTSVSYNLSSFLHIKKLMAISLETN